MTVSLQDSVYHKPVFEKIADYELPQDVSKWNDKILDQFYSDVDYLPKEMGVDIVVNSVDENKGYAKGSIVVFYGENKINFPIIVNDFKLCIVTSKLHEVISIVSRKSIIFISVAWSYSFISHVSFLRSCKAHVAFQF